MSFNDTSIYADDGTPLFEPVPDIDKFTLRDMPSSRKSTTIYPSGVDLQTLLIFYGNHEVGEYRMSATQSITQEALEYIKVTCALHCGLLAYHASTMDTSSTENTVGEDGISPALSESWESHRIKISSSGVTSLNRDMPLYEAFWRSCALAEHLAELTNSRRKVLEESFDTFWRIARLSPHQFIYELRGFVQQAVSLAPRSDYSRIEQSSLHKNVVEAYRFLPGFFMQNEHNALGEFIAGTELSVDRRVTEGRWRKRIFGFIEDNKHRLSSNSIYEEVLKIDRGILEKLVTAGHKMPSNGSVKAVLFDLHSATESYGSYSSRSAFHSEFYESLSVIHQALDRNPDPTGMVSPLISRIINDLWDDLMNVNVDENGVMQRFRRALMVPRWASLLLQSVELEGKEIYPILDSLWNSGWAKGDSSSRTVLRRMFREIPLPDIASILLEVKGSGIQETSAQWFQYIDRYEEYQDIPVELALAMHTKSRA